MTTETAGNTSLKINTDPIVTIFDCSILFAFCIVGKVRYKWIGVRDIKLKYKDLWFYVQVVIKTVNEVISRCCFAVDGTDLSISAYRTCSTRIFTRSTNKVLNLWLCRCRSRD